MKIIKILLIVSLLSLIGACDIIDRPYEQDGEVIVEPTDNERRALLIEFTGINCPNCPAASKEAHRIIDKYEGKVIGLNIHASTLAKPNSASQPNFKNSTSDEIYASTNRPSLPGGLISQFLVGDAVSNSTVNWETEVADVISKNADIEIKITKTDKFNFEIEFFKELSSDLRIAAYFTEFDYIGYQLDGTTQIPDYNHSYILRTSILGDLGQDLNLTNIIDKKLSVQADIPAIDAKWTAENLRVVCFVYDVSTRDVLQVNEIKFIE